MYIDINNTTLHYNIYGEQNRDVIICLHGNGENGDYFVRQVEYFSDKYKVITIDSRAQGKSSWNGEVLSISLLADDVITFCKSKDVSKAIFIGFSDGANILMDMLIKTPNLISRAILNGGNIKYKGLKSIVRMILKLNHISLKLSCLFSDKNKQKLQVWSLMMSDISHDYSDFGDVKVPCLVIAGDNDMIKQCENERIHESLLDSEIKIIEGNHFIARNKSVEFNNCVSDFILKN